MQFNGSQFLKAWNSQIALANQFIEEANSYEGKRKQEIDDLLDCSQLKIKNVDEVIQDKIELAKLLTDKEEYSINKLQNIEEVKSSNKKRTHGVQPKLEHIPSDLSQNSDNENDNLFKDDQLEIKATKQTPNKRELKCKQKLQKIKLAHQIAQKIEIPSEESVKQHLQSESLESCKPHMKLIQIWDRNYIQSHYDSPDFPQAKFDQQDNIFVKFTFYSQLKRQKQTELVTLGDRTLQDIMDAYFKLKLCPQPENSKKYCFIQMEEAIYCQKQHRQSIIDDIHEEYESQVEFYDIDRVKIIDLKHIRIGFPYLLRHMDECDHLFIISEVRLQDPQKDKKLISSQPLVEEVFAKKQKRAECDICEENLCQLALVYDQKLSDGNVIEEQTNETFKSISKVAVLCMRCKDMFQEDQNHNHVKLFPYNNEV